MFDPSSYECIILLKNIIYFIVMIKTVIMLSSYFMERLDSHIIYVKREFSREKELKNIVFNI
jgi:hypothetical protein